MDKVSAVLFLCYEIPEIYDFGKRAVQINLIKRQDILVASTMIHWAKLCYSPKYYTKDNPELTENL